MDSIAYVNGSLVPLSEAKVSILDRGFLFADGIYEVSAVLDGKLVDNASHLARLERSVGEISLKLPESEAVSGTIYTIRSMRENLRQELLRAVAAGRAEEVLLRRVLDDLALVHEDDAMRDL